MNMPGLKAHSGTLPTRLTELLSTGQVFGTESRASETCIPSASSCQVETVRWQQQESRSGSRALVLELAVVQN